MIEMMLIGLLGLAGYVLGIIGFFRANSAHDEIWRLRQALAMLSKRLDQLGADEPAAVVVPEPPRPSPLPAAVSVPVVHPPPRQVLVDPTQNSTIEAAITQRWGVWLGSAALLFAGVFLIRYAVEQGVFGPGVRCVMATLLGLLLLTGADLLARTAPDLGVRGWGQAPAGLAAGGVAVLFGAAYGAGPLYGFLSPLLGFGAMALVSFIGLFAALRYGKLTAATGIVGAFATPALVATQSPSWPGLFAYLGVVSLASMLVVRFTAWIWLAWCTAIASVVWMLIAATQSGPEIWAVSAFLPLAVLVQIGVLPAAALDRREDRALTWLPLGMLALTGLLIEVMVPGLPPLMAVLSNSLIAIWRGYSDDRLDRLPWLAGLVGLLGLLLWNLSTARMPSSANVEQMLAGFLFAANDAAPIQQFFVAAILFVLLHAGTGLVLERRAPRPLVWSALPAAVPVLALLIAYLKVAHFEVSLAWAVAAVALGAGLTATAGWAAREGGRQRAGVHAAGATASLALACAMLMRDQWLSLAVTLFLPALAAIEARVGLQALRKVAIAVASVALLRLAGNWYVLDYAFGPMPLANGLIVAYALPAAACALASFWFRRGGNDATVAMLEASACSLGAIFIALELRHGFGNGALTGRLGFLEAALHVATLAAQALMLLMLHRRSGRAVIGRAWEALGGLAYVGAVGLILFNPAVVGPPVGIVALAIAYLVPAALAMLARARLPYPDLRDLLGAYALVAGFAWISLQIRQAFHPGGMLIRGGMIDGAELWAWSGAWLAYGLALMVWGIRADLPKLRYAALGIIGLVCVKAVLIDMDGLTGLWRVLSFLGLGLGLIGLSLIRSWLAPRPQQP